MELETKQSFEAAIKALPINEIRNTLYKVMKEHGILYKGWGKDIFVGWYDGRTRVHILTNTDPVTIEWDADRENIPTQLPTDQI